MSSERLRKPSRKPAAATARNGHSKPKPTPVVGRIVPDQLDVSAQDLHWLRVAWEIGRASLDRAAAALGSDWHRAVALLRLLDVTGNDHSRGTPRIVEEIELPAGPTSWFIHVDQPDRTYRVALGFRTRTGRFHQVIQSRAVHPARTTVSPKPNGRTATHVEDAEGWPLDLYTGRCHLSGDLEGEATPSEVAAELASCPLQVEAELIIRGAAASKARVTLVGKPVVLSEDGRFCQRVPLNAGRQVIPVVATAADKSAERTVVIALEMSVRELEPRVYGEL